MKRSSGFTLIELLVVISIIAILASLALPAITGALARGQMTQTLSNMKQLHLVCQQMALDATTTGDTNIGWPGDLTNASVSSFNTWVPLVVPAYMGTNDFAKMISAPGVVCSSNSIATTTVGKDRALYLYPVTETNDSGTVLFTSANYQYTVGSGPALVASTKPYGDKGFLVFRKGGDGSVFQARQATNVGLVGTCPGTAW